jgi:hypothetical protein
MRLYSLLLDYWLPSTFEEIGNKLGKYVKTSEETLKGRYTSYARICIEMDVLGALPEAISLEFRDEEWIQSIDYEKIHFRCRRFHEHGHLLENSLSIKNKKRKTPKYNKMRMGLSSRTTETEKTRNQVIPQWEAIQKTGLERKGMGQNQQRGRRRKGKGKIQRS